MTQDLFKNWFYNYFIPTVETYKMEENIYFKVLLVFDNAACHNIELDYPYVKILFLSPNCTSLVQKIKTACDRTVQVFV